MNTGVYVLTGYLGSGKTTLVQRLLSYLRMKGGNVVVIMNEMGEEDIDGELLSGFGFPVKKLMDGCICCSIRGELTEGLKEVVFNLQPEHIIIETTGVADPFEMVDALTMPELYDKLELKGLISVVDASRFLGLNSRFQSNGSLVTTIRNQVKYADLLVLNKIDLASTATLDKVKHKLRELNPAAPIEHTINSEVDLPSLLAVKRLNQRLAEEAKPLHSAPIQTSVGRFSPLDKLKQTLGVKSSQPSLYKSIQSFSYAFWGPVDSKKFERFLLCLPKSVYRAKGYVLFYGNENEVISFQQTDNQVHLIPFENFGPKMVAVFIGEGMDQDKIIADLETCY